ncbi:hypothetical protein [Vulcanisaeta sp. JCM 16161]|uniref:hypothetical protein n=1 Tax=Vulcanisaeta sp. JCM 16161 TaxID=1295372 RepID=UPI0006D08296|nr:hypothetical protein [Vulcanisaeta sp. JCM 16161]
MNNRDINVEELTKNFRVSFDKAGLTIYVIPKENAVPLTSGLSYPFNNEDVQLYGTKVILHLPCSGAVYGRYLIQNGDYVEGLYLVIIDTECDIGVSWHEEGLSTKIHVKPSESLIVIVRLMRLRPVKLSPIVMPLGL